MTGADTILREYLAGAVPANVALMRLLVDAPVSGGIEAVLRARREAAGDAQEAEQLGTLLDLLAAHPDAGRTIRAVMAEADHDTTADPSRWAAVFDRLAEAEPEAGVALYALGSPQLLAAATDEVTELMRSWGLLGPDRDLLEIGCGYGRLAAALAPNVRSARGLDISTAMIAEGRRRFPAITNLSLAVSDGETLDTPNASRDVVLAADMFPYLVAAGPALAERNMAEIARVLRPGGALLILNYSYRDDPDLDRREVASLFAAHGFTAERAGTRDLELWDATTYLGRRNDRTR